MRAAIWANSRRVGDNQLLKIEKQYNLFHIETKRKIMSSSGSWIEFENGDVWKVCTHTSSSRGYKYNIAYIERNIPEEVVNQIIKPQIMACPYQAFNYFWGDED